MLTIAKLRAHHARNKEEIKRLRSAIYYRDIHIAELKTKITKIQTTIRKTP